MNSNTAGGVFPPVANPLTNYKNYEHYYHSRKPKKVTLFCNGDQYFPGKTITLTPHRYLSINDMLNDITHKLPTGFRLPYGVRQLFTPTGGRKVKRIEEIKDGQKYVCGGFESFKLINYGTAGMQPWRTPAKAQAVNLNEMYNMYDQRKQAYITNNGFQPNRHSFRSMFAYRKGGLSSYNAQAKPIGATPARTRPRLITIVRNSNEPRTTVKLLLNRQGVNSYEQLLEDVTEALGPRWKRDRVQKLFSSKGRPINGLVDFFRQRDTLFIATGSEALTPREVVSIVNDYGKSEGAGALPHKVDDQRQEGPSISERRDRLMSKPDDKRDSGFQDEPESTEEPAIAQDWRSKKKFEPVIKSEMIWRLEQERAQAAERERERAHKRMEKRVENETKMAEEQRQRQGLSPLKPVESAMKKLQNAKKLRRTSRDTESTSPPRQLAPVIDREVESKQILEELKEKEEKDTRRSIKELLQKKRKLPDLVTKELRRKPNAEDKNVESRPSELPSPNKLPEIRASPEPEPLSEKEAKIDETDPIAMVAKQNTPQSVSGELPKERILEGSEKTPEPEAGKADAEQEEPKNDAKLPSDNAEPPHIESEANEVPPPKQPDPKELESQKDTNQTKLNAEDPGASTEDVQPSKDESNKENEKPPLPPEEKENLEELRKKHRQKKKVEKGRFVREVSNADNVYNQFELGKVMGDGNFAIVRQCRKKITKSDFALKIIDKAKLKGKEHMIENEIKIMKVCDHANIVKLYEEYETKEEIFLVMELVRGGDLFDCITSNVKFEENVAAGMVHDLASGLYYLHSRKIVHRDIKPENLLVFRASDGNLALKLGDFGLAMEVTELIFTVCGTPTYVAPEILKEIGYGLEIDLWATGVITYILLCGFPPFRSQERRQSELFSLIKSGVYEFLRPYWDNVSKSAKDLIERLLLVNRRERYTAIDVLCHPWIITKGNALPLPDDFEVSQRVKKKELEKQSKEHREKYIAQKMLMKNVMK